MIAVEGKSMCSCWSHSCFKIMCQGCFVGLFCRAITIRQWPWKRSERMLENFFHVRFLAPCYQQHSREQVVISFQDSFFVYWFSYCYYFKIAKWPVASFSVGYRTQCSFWLLKRQPPDMPSLFVLELWRDHFQHFLVLWYQMKCSSIHRKAFRKDWSSCFPKLQLQTGHHFHPSECEIPLGLNG